MDTHQLPEAEIEQGRSISIIWLLPVIAAVIGGWLVYQSWAERGPLITIAFARGDGIEADKTTLRYKAVQIGKVTSVGISEDLKSVVASARIDKNFAHHLREQTRFWVVRPRVGASGISGLGTLVSGAYIEIDPGDGEPRYAFQGLESPPIVAANVPGNRYVLQAEKLGSIQAGSAIFFRDIQVGEVLGHALAADGSRVTIHIFVREPYTELVRETTRFSNASGINVSVDADGVELQTSSLQSLLVGGISFDLPLRDSGEPALPGTEFRLYDSYENSNDAQFAEQIPFILYFDDSVRGLSVGAPVEFKGIKLGSVSQIDLEVDDRSADIRIPVLVTLQAQRLASDSLQQMQHPHAIIDSLIGRGLRARLQTGSLLTGQMFIELGLYPETPVRMITGRLPLAQIPTIPSEFVEIKDSATELLDRLRQLPLEEIGEGTRDIVVEVEALLKAPELRKLLTSADRSLVAVETLMRNLDAELKPLAGRLSETLDGLDEDSALHAQLRATLARVNDAAKALRALAESVERQPSALIWGKNRTKPESANEQ